MLILASIVLLLGAFLVVFLWAGTYFFQGYIYTEPTRGIAWQAPAAAAAVTLFLGVWALIVASSENASPSDIPYDTLFRFSPEVSMFKEPAKEMWAHKQGGKVVHYARKKLGPTKYCYHDTTYDARPWSSTKVEAIDLEYQGQKVRFVPRTDTSRGAYREFVSEDGWVMRDYDDSSRTSGPTGLPQQFRYGRLLANLGLNFGLLAVVFGGLIVLDYQWLHALGLSLAIWVIMTLALLPMVLGYAAEIAAKRPAAQAPASAEQ